MRCFHVTVVAAILALGALNCNESTTIMSPRLGGRFLYKSFDSTGTKIVEGWLTLIYRDSVHITGEWHFQKVGSPQRIGPQVGDGVLEGGVRDETVWVELQPQNRDNNLQLTGTIENGRYHGEWVWISFVGVTNRGPFEAIRE